MYRLCLYESHFIQLFREFEGIVFSFIFLVLVLVFLLNEFFMTIVIVFYQVFYNLLSWNYLDWIQS